MRYSRQIGLEKWGMEGQNKLGKSTVAVIGCGATGSAVSSVLARSGVNLILCDGDSVEKTNLHRQIMFFESDVGKNKASVLGTRLNNANSEISVNVIGEYLNDENTDVLLQADMVIDCTDNIDVRYMINRFSVENNIKWIYTGVSGREGMFMPVLPEKYCFNCIFPEKFKKESKCEAVHPSLPVAVGSMAAHMAIDILIGSRQDDGRYMKLHYLNMSEFGIRKIDVKKRDSCEVCGIRKR